MGSEAEVTRAARKVSTRDTEAAPPDSTERTGLSSVLLARQKQELEDRRRSLIRFFRMAIPGWSAFVLADFAVAYLNGAGRGLPLLLALRLAGACIGLLGYSMLRKKELPHATLTGIEGSLTFAAAVLVSLGALAYGGLTSHLVLGVAIVAVVRSIVAAPWRRALPLALACALAFPVTLGIAALFLAPIRAQWTDPKALSLFAQNQLLLLFGAIVGAWASHLQWAARREVFEARKLGNYRLKVRIGGGGMGDVWLARQDPLGRHVALKLLRETGAKANMDSIRRFEREARAASTLTHPNTIKVFDFGASDDGVFYIAMELLHGLDLEDVVSAGGTMPASRVIHIARQVCASLTEAHDRGIIHRDIKPANIFLTGIGDDHDFVKVLDFGVAHVAREAKSIDTGLAGTPAYMAPEVVRGEGVSPATDVYSLGALMYFMLTGSELFKNLSFGATVMAQVSKVPDSPSKRLGSPVAPDLERVVMKCLEKSRTERYATARALDAALAACEAAGKWSRDDARNSWDAMRPSLRFRFRSNPPESDKAPS
jgi:serine/threonine-protein kinase